MTLCGLTLARPSAEPNSTVANAVSLSPHRFRARPLTRLLALHKNGLAVDMYVIGRAKSTGYRAAGNAADTRRIYAMSRRWTTRPLKYVDDANSSQYVSTSVHDDGSVPVAAGRRTSAAQLSGTKRCRRKAGDGTASGWEQSARRDGRARPAMKHQPPWCSLLSVDRSRGHLLDARRGTHRDCRSSVSPACSDVVTSRQPLTALVG